MSNFRQDLRYGWRMLTKNPGFTSVAILTLALGIGVNSAIFSAVSAFIIRPLRGTAAPERLTVAFEITRDGDRGQNFSYPDYQDYRDRNQTFAGLAAQTMTQVVLGTGQENDVIWGEIVSGNYFETLGVRASLGRTFLPEENRVPEASAVVVLSHRLWQRRFAADPNIVGRTVAMNGRPFTIIGIAPEEFYGTKWGLSMDFWVPMMMQRVISPGGDLLNERGARWFQIFGRLKDGVTATQAASELTNITKQLAEEYPNGRYKELTFEVVPEIEGRFGDAGNVVKLSARMALAVVGLLLLIVCANVANLLLARAAARRREIGIRMALGASRFRLIRQLLTESLLMSLIGGALGLGLSFWTTDFFSLLLPSLPYTFGLNFAPDLRVVAFTFVVAVATGIVFGLAPALQSTRVDLVPILKGEAATMGAFTRRFTLRNLLVVAQVALSLVVLVCGGLFARSLQKAQSIDPGFRTRQAVALTTTPGLLGYTRQQGLDFYEKVVARAQTMAGVEAAAVLQLMPLGDSSNSTGPIIRQGDAAPAPGRGMNTMVNSVGPGYFATLQIPILDGREFNRFDQRDAAPVAIINETMARRLWPNESAVGKRFSIGSSGGLIEIVGVAKEGKYRSLGESPLTMLYLPVTQNYSPTMTLVIRTSGDPRAIISRVREEIKAIDAQMPLYNIRTIDEHLTYALWGPRLGATIASLFGVLALALAVLGLYGLMSYVVSQRTKEIGIRIALGAPASAVQGLIARQGMRLCLLGLALGLPLAWSTALALSKLLYGVKSADPLVFGGVIALLGGSSLLASYLPARRALKVDPMSALREQ
jgi:predicted permease